MTNHQTNIESLINNSNQKLESAEILAQNQDYASASSLLVTAFEEKTKAVALQFKDLGYQLTENEGDLDYLFQHHDLRHYVGFFVDCIYEIVRDLKEVFERYITDINFQNSIIQQINEDPKLIEDAGVNWINNKIDSCLEILSFYQNIEKERQRGLYIDVLQNQTSNASIEKQDYEFVKNRLNAIHWLSSNITELKSNSDPKVISSIQQSQKRINESGFLKLVSDSIQLVKKKRGKAFNDIRRELIFFRDGFPSIKDIDGESFMNLNEKQ